MIKARIKVNKQIEEGLLDFFRKKKKVNKTSTPIHQQITSKEKEAEKGDIGDYQKDYGFDAKFLRPQQKHSEIDISSENPHFYRQIMYNISPLFGVKVKDLKNFLQKDSFELSMISNRLKNLHKQVPKALKMDEMDLALSISGLMSKQDKQKASMLSGQELLNFQEEVFDLALEKAWGAKHARDAEMKNREKNLRDLGMIENKKVKLRIKNNLNEKKKDDPCWKNYEQYGTKQKNGKEVPNCVKIEEYDLAEGEQSLFLEKLEYKGIQEAEYQGKKVTLNKPIRTSGESKKFKVYVKDGDKVKVVRFGDPNMKIKKNNPERRRSFRARHKCDNPGPKTKAKYWSCKAW